MDAFTAAQTTELVSRIGTKKASMRLDKLFVNSLMVGPLLGFACAIVLSVNAAPWYQENAPGLIRMIGSLLFPAGLVMIVLTGADLFTSNIMFMTVALLHRRVSILDTARVWTISFFGNLAGTLFFMAIITGYSNVYSTPGYQKAIHTFATEKVIEPQWHQIFLRAIGANWLVCLAVYLSVSSREIVSKIIAIWWPTATFVALALDHVVANMFFIPTAIFYNTPHLTTSLYIWKSLIPTTLGNIVGGAVFVGLPYWYLYLFQEETEIDFNIGGTGTAVAEMSGPMRQGPSLKHGILHAHQLPHSGAGFTSAVSRELSEEKWGKKKDEENDVEKTTRKEGSESERTQV